MVLLWEKKQCFNFFSAVLDRILFILAGNDYIVHESLDEFKIRQNQPLVSMVTDRVMMGKKGVSTLSRLFFIRYFHTCT